MPEDTKGKPPDLVPLNSPIDRGEGGETKTQETKPEERLPEIMGGRFKSIGDLEKSYQEAEKEIGRKGNEIGEVRKRSVALEQELQRARQQLMSLQEQQRERGQEMQSPGFEQQRQQIIKAFNDGLISESEKTDRLIDLKTEEKVQAIAQRLERQMAETMNSRDALQLEKEFIQAHPDFVEMRESGALDEFIKANPMHDLFSGYFALHSMRAKEALTQRETEHAAALEAAKLAAFEEGRKQIQDIAKGGESARSVITGPGQSLQDLPSTEGMSDRDILGLITKRHEARQQNT